MSILGHSVFQLFTIGRKMKRSTAIRIGLLAIVVIAMGGLAFAANRTDGKDDKSASGKAPPVKAKSGLPIERVVIQGEDFDLEVAANDANIQRGLSKRPEIAPKTGMIFIFPSGNDRSFWMINCLIDMDIAYLAPDGTVVSVYTMKKEEPQARTESDFDYETRLKRYPSGPGVQFVIETPAGTNDALKIKPGVKIAIDRSKMAGYLKSEASSRN